MSRKAELREQLAREDAIQLACSPDSEATAARQQAQGRERHLRQLAAQEAFKAAWSRCG